MICLRPFGLDWQRRDIRKSMPRAAAHTITYHKYIITGNKYITTFHIDIAICGLEVVSIDYIAVKAPLPL